MNEANSNALIGARVISKIQNLSESPVFTGFFVNDMSEQEPQSNGRFALFLFLGEAVCRDLNKH